MIINLQSFYKATKPLTVSAIIKKQSIGHYQQFAYHETTLQKFERNYKICDLKNYSKVQDIEVQSLGKLMKLLTNI